MSLTRLRWVRSGLACAATAPTTAVLLSEQCDADASQPPPPLPVYTPSPSDWSPKSDVWPYNIFRSRVTPEMIGGMSGSCQWFTAQFDPLMGQINDFNGYLGNQHDDYSIGGVQGHADAVVAPLDISAVTDQ